MLKGQHQMLHADLKGKEELVNTLTDKLKAEKGLLFLLFFVVVVVVAVDDVIIVGCGGDGDGDGGGGGAPGCGGDGGMKRRN